MSIEPAEHARLHGYVRTLAQVSDIDECDLLAHVLSDPDRAMADSAVIGYPDRRAAALCDDASFIAWSQRIARVLDGHQLPERRLREWSLLNEIDSGRPRNTADPLSRTRGERTGSGTRLAPASSTNLPDSITGQPDRQRHPSSKSLDNYSSSHHFNTQLRLFGTGRITTTVFGDADTTDLRFT